MEHGPSGKLNRHTPVCLCGAEGIYTTTLDTYYCPMTGVWVEPECACTEEECPFPKRPEKHWRFQDEPSRNGGNKKPNR